MGWLIKQERRGLVRPLSFFVAASVIYFVIPLALAIVNGEATTLLPPVILVALGNFLVAVGYFAVQRTAISPRFLDADTRARITTRLPGVGPDKIFSVYLAVAVACTVAFFV